MRNQKYWPMLIAGLLAGCPAKDSDDDGLMLPIDTMPPTTTAGTVPPDDDGMSEEESGSTTSSEGSGESGEPMGVCGEGMCAEPAPDGWFGPVVRFDSGVAETPPLCNNDWPDAAFTLLGGYVDPGAAECTCSCGINVGALCNSYGYLYEGVAGCSGAAQYTPFTSEDTCEAATVNSGSVRLYAYTMGAATCSSEVASEVPEVPWDLQVAGCRGAEWGAECAEGRQCLPQVPEGYDNNLCIFAEGDHECPGGDYSEKTTLYSGADDDRRCGPCACDTPPATTCTGTFEVFDNDDCTGNLLLTAPASGGTCSGDVTDMGSLRFVYDGDSSCPVFEDSSPLGSIEPAGQMTYCCASSAGGE